MTDSSGNLFSKRVDEIKKLSELGIPTLISLTAIGLVLWHGIKIFPNYLDKQSAAITDIAASAKMNAETNIEIKNSMEDIKEAAEESVKTGMETRVFMEAVRSDHSQLKDEHDTHSEALRDLLSKHN